MTSPIILASKSPRRKHLLELAAIEFEIITKETDESFPEGMNLEEIPVYIALQKANDIHNDYPGRRVLAADTIVVLNNEVIGKPVDREDAIRILSALSGQIHTVITGVVLIDGNDVKTLSDRTEVEFHPLTQTQIEYYVDTCKPYDKAGAYAIQEWIGVIAIKRINGCFYNVMGLPVSRVVGMLGQG